MATNCLDFFSDGGTAVSGVSFATVVWSRHSTVITVSYLDPPDRKKKLYKRSTPMFELIC